jgi:hypothetical protein
VAPRDVSYHKSADNIEPESWVDDGRRERKRGRDASRYCVLCTKSAAGGFIRPWQERARLNQLTSNAGENKCTIFRFLGDQITLIVFMQWPGTRHYTYYYTAYIYHLPR